MPGASSGDGAASAEMGAPHLHFTIVGQPSEPEIDKQPQTIFMPVTPGYYSDVRNPADKGAASGWQGPRRGSGRVAMVEMRASASTISAGRGSADATGEDCANRAGEEAAVWRSGGMADRRSFSRRAGVSTVIRRGVRQSVDVPFDCRSSWPQTVIGVRTSGEPSAIATSVAAAVRSVNPEYPMTQVRTMDQVVSESLVMDWLTLLVLGEFWSGWRWRFSGGDFRDLWGDDVFGGAAEA